MWCDDNVNDMAGMKVKFKSVANSEANVIQYTREVKTVVAEAGKTWYNLIFEGTRERTLNNTFWHEKQRKK